MNDSNLLKTLQYFYDIYRSTFNRFLDFTKNSYENQIIRKLINKPIFSIDPKNCIDIDDAISFEIFDTHYLVTIYIFSNSFFILILQ